MIGLFRRRDPVPRFPAVGDALSHALRAAVLDDERGDAAWRSWLRTLDGRTPAGTEKQIAPQLYRTRLRRGIDDAARSLLEPFSRRAWVKHQMDRVTLADTLARMREAGIDALVLKGAALIPLYYRDPAARFAGDIDVLVPVDRHREAVKVLLGGGWRATQDPGLFDSRFRHAIHVVRGGAGVDVHCHVLLFNCEPGADAAFWDGAVPMNADGVATRTLGPTHHLLHVCAHSAVRVPVTPVRWYTDAAAILRVAGDAIDWDRLVADARDRRVTAIVGLALGALRDVLELAIPQTTLRALQETQIGRVEHLLLATGPVRRQGRPLRLIAWAMVRFYRATFGLSRWSRWRMFPAFVKDWLRIGSWWRVPAGILSKVTASISRRMKGE